MPSGRMASLCMFATSLANGPGQWNYHNELDHGQADQAGLVLV